MINRTAEAAAMSRIHFSAQQKDSPVILRYVLEGVLLIGLRVNICSIFGAIYSETDLFLSRRRA
jgi:hypothetical protein